MSSELKPCPFCGGTRTEHKEDCYIYLLTTYKWFNCEKAWNQRAERTCNLIDRTEMFQADIDSLDTYWNFSCGHRMYGNQWEKPSYCVVCGAKVVD